MVRAVRTSGSCPHVGIIVRPIVIVHVVIISTKPQFAGLAGVITTIRRNGNGSRPKTPSDDLVRVMAGNGRANRPSGLGGILPSQVDIVARSR